MVMIEKLVSKMHNKIVMGGEDTYTELELKAIALYARITDILYHELIKTYSIIVQNKELSYKYLKYKYHHDNIIIVRDDFTPPYLSKVSNSKGRVVHDYIHYRWNYDFSLDGEYKTCDRQIEIYNHLINKFKLLDFTLKESYYIKDMLCSFLVSEIKLQAAYYERYKEFPSRQVIIW
jgi:hypothetical protein